MKIGNLGAFLLGIAGLYATAWAIGKGWKKGQES